MRHIEAELDERQQNILLNVVEIYLRTGREVGSAVVAKTGAVKLSSASIRNIMRDLEVLGYLNQVHTSGGRVPTLKAFKYYTKSLLKYIEPSREERAFIRKMLIPYKEDLKQMITETPRVLSTLSNYISIALIPDLGETPLIRVDIVRLTKNRAVVILVAKTGYLSHVSITLKSMLSQKELNEIAEHFNTKFSGMSINRAKKLLMEELFNESILIDRMLIENDTESGFGEGKESEIVMEGQTNILFQPEFTNIEKLIKLLRALNEKKTLIQLLNEVIKSGQLLILFGAEYNIEGLSDCAVVAAPYKSSLVPPGSIGIIGPVRMDYSKTIPLIEYTTNFISEWIN